MLILPATADVDRRVHRRGRGRARGAVDDRQRHALPADALRPRGAARQARHPRADGLCRRRRGRGARPGAVPRPGAADRRHAQADALPGDLSAGRRRRTIPLAIARTMFVDRIDLPVAETIVEHLEASDAAMRVAQLRVLGGAMARVPADATAFAHRRSRIMVNVASFYEGPEDKDLRAAWVDGFAARSSRTTAAPTSTSSSTRARNGSAPRTRARPGTGSRRSRLATTRPTCSGSTRTFRRGRS